MSRVLLAPVSGRATQAIWSQAMVLGGVHGHWVELDELPKGVLLACVTITVSGEVFEGADLGKELASELDNFWNGDGNVVSGEELLALGKSLQNKIEGITSLKLLLVHFSKDLVHVVGNSGQVLLKRGDQLAKLFEGNGEYVLMEGRYEHNDRWLLGTDGLMVEMDPAFAAALLRLDTVSLAGEELSTQVQAIGASEAVAGLIVHTEPQPTPKEETVVDRGTEKPQPEVYLRQEKRRRLAAIVGVVILVLLFVSLGFGWRQRQERLWKDRLGAVQGESQVLVEKARGMSGNSSEARALVQQALQRARAALEEYPEKKEYQAQLTEHIKSLEQTYQAISGENQANVSEWFDLGLVRDDFFGQYMAISEDRLVVLDGERGLLAGLTVTNKQSSLVGGGALLSQAKDVALSGTRAVSISQTGVVELSMATKTTAVLVAPEPEWQQVAKVGLFGGNVYVVDAGAGAIWHYPGLESGVGSRRLWFGPGVTPDLSRVADIAIDGDIWLLNSGGEVSRFRRGAPLAFRVSGLDIPITEATSISVTGDSEEGKVFILDRMNKRVVVTNKEGAYEKQYLWDGLAGVSDMGVAEEQNLILLLSGSTIYSIQL